MYEKHFNLTASPFNAGPDPKFLYMTDVVSEALSVLAYGVTARKGFLQLTGAVGTGKTTLLNIFLQWLQARDASTAFIFNPHLSPDEFLDLMLTDFGIDRKSTTKSQTMLHFNQWLLERYHADKLAVVFVDEAQQLSPAVLEELRLLTNLETPTHKLLQIVLCGQPELETLLACPSLSQLRQRITLRCRTARFTSEQTAGYIEQRLSIAGAKTKIFLPDAVHLIHRYSNGIARLINVLCEHAMIESYCRGTEKIDAEIVERAAREAGIKALPDVDSERRDVRRAIVETDAIGEAIAVQMAERSL
jgi:general secretion pathway protein A